MKNYIVALDQGTTSSRAIVFDHKENIISMAQKEFPQIYPKNGWVEHDPMEIYSGQFGVMMEAITRGGIRPEEIAAIGITNQRETTLVWEKATGRPICNAIVWQCRRTAAICDELKARGLEEYIRNTTGLVLDAYFSATKIKWILDHVPGARQKAERGELLFGTVDTWLLWKLTEGKVHATDYTNASRTMLFDIHRLCWDEKLAAELEIPLCMLPEVRPSSGIFGYCNIQGCSIPIAGIAGDQQAALFGQCCFREGEAKNTYGTGCFLLMHTGNQPCISKHGLVTTLAAGIDQRPCYALEGSVFVAGAVVQWLRDEMELIGKSSEAEARATAVADTGGVYFVPAFTGLGAPHWDMYARGAIVGISRGTRAEHIIRAALESIAYQSMELVEAMEKDTGIRLAELKVDGGASVNSFLMQFQSDILDALVRRPRVRETTALGAACLAGLAVGFWKDTKELRALWQCDRSFAPNMTAEQRHLGKKNWAKAVGRSRQWEDS